MAATTEARHRQAEGLDGLPPSEILSVLLDGQLSAVESVRNALPSIENAARLAASKIASGGRLIYAGAGSSGLMALSDGLELPGTFGIAPEQALILLAGGADSLELLAGGYEDDEVLAEEDVTNANVSARDCLIGVSASGSTPYTVRAAAVAKAHGASVIGIANNADTPLLNGADVAILLQTPPEAVAGSTRMGAGTAQKITLNMISTLTAVHLGHVHDGFMVNLRADNDKLRDRARRIVSVIAGTDIEKAGHLLEEADGSVKIAVLLAAGADGAQSAGKLLESCNQNLRSALKKAKAGS
ncbi:N-acetylmuramic acid 6-phosphate etherase [Rhizobium sp. TH2]|uniref:N-acetylmuramic acid 6-phosphate etherase n=1 Tax=Rhizobium sp. TH2 TaxID=2775403 RepID=UPI0021570B17|nr:N-acetylmuramic acid 6-phosphate etherase [Rhizobium sp. TH2]UVC09771.1 N-acetylmuramic acid 6-phosphate etherase [Rhizobium sp. TH2]